MKTEEFDRSVYSALEQITNKLQEHENLRSLKNTYIIQDGDTIVKTPSRKMTIATNSGVKVIRRVQEEVSIKETSSSKQPIQQNLQKDSIMLIQGPRDLNIVLNDARKTQIKVRKSYKDPKALINEARKALLEAKEMQKLVNKMMVEINLNDFNQRDKDSLKSLIRKTLMNKGIFMPFEFSLQKIFEKQKDTLVQSEGFSEENKYYQADLSLNKVFPTHNFLRLQFSNQNTQILAAMKGSVILSVLFSLMIISTFFYTLRLIFRQKKISEIKNDFINNMTHELKTPTATISLATDALNNPIIKYDETKFTEYTHILKEESQKLNNHVERVLQMALIEKGELKLNKQLLNINDLIRNSIRNHALAIQKLNADVRFNPAKEEIPFLFDEFHLGHVINNLLDNALKYHSEVPIIEISSLEKNGELFIHVKDNGIGIEPEKKQKVFDQFYRAQGGNLHDVKGSGLGLSYAKSIVEAHGGSIRLESEKGKGSEFIIKFETHA